MLSEHFWSADTGVLLSSLESAPEGLTSAQALARMPVGAGRPTARKRAQDRYAARLRALLAQFKSPITIMMMVGAGISVFLGDLTEGMIILAIVCMGGLLGFWQESRADGIVEKLMGLLTMRIRVRRDGSETLVDRDSLVPGDIVLLQAGSAVPGDGVILVSNGLFADESALTGESFPAGKRPGVNPAEAPPHERSGAVFMGTHIISGTGSALMVQVGKDTVFGRISKGLQRPAPETAFERGSKRFGYLLLEFALALAVVIFALNVAFDRPVLDSLLFTLALAVGLTPQLLPAIQGITLSRGAARMAGKGVVVRRLSSIEDIGGMTILCTDKTGTLTEGEAGLRTAEDAWGGPGRNLRLYAYLNASLQSGYANPIDAVLCVDKVGGSEAYAKKDEVPYDFTRKRLSVAVAGPEGLILITKGALEGVLEACSWAEGGDGLPVGIAQVSGRIHERAEALGREGCRCLGIAYRKLDSDGGTGPGLERNLIFLGILAFQDPIKAGARSSLAALRDLGISVKMITGDNRVVAACVAREAGLRPERILVGGDIEGLGLLALSRKAARAEVFAEMDPGQKERIILALKKSGEAVGYLGDGINDAPALYAADVGISVDSAADSTKQAADIVLLRKDLHVLADGVREGRRAFANTLKYVFITSSANLGNMVAMAAASLFTPFLPMLPKQILFLNFLSDLPAMAIAGDRLDPEQVARPRHWDNREIQGFMIVFGLISSVFDILTFASLLAMHVEPDQFRTAWFLESLLSEVLVLLVIRTRRMSFRSLPGKGLMGLSALVGAVSLALPWIPQMKGLGFAPLTPRILLLLFAILSGYVVVSELAKRPFYARAAGNSGNPVKPRKSGKRNAAP
ncbi:MAG: magnesium-translocating P-type ATPase [Fibrobacteria bacterium]